jgi:hypothetical protein
MSLNTEHEETSIFWLVVIFNVLRRIFRPKREEVSGD